MKSGTVPNTTSRTQGNYSPLPKRPPLGGGVSPEALFHKPETQKISHNCDFHLVDKELPYRSYFSEVIVSLLFTVKCKINVVCLQPVSVTNGESNFPNAKSDRIENFKRS